MKAIRLMIYVRLDDLTVRSKKKENRKIELLAVLITKNSVGLKTLIK